MIGYGALGAFYDKTHPSKSRKIIVSFVPNIFLNSYGFINSIIGKKDIGLAAKWHGVLTKQVPNTWFVKKDVLFKIKRLYPPVRQSDRLDVVSIKRENLWWEIQSVSQSGDLVYDYANRIILAAGPLEN